MLVTMHMCVLISFGCRLSQICSIQNAFWNFHPLCSSVAPLCLYYASMFTTSRSTIISLKNLIILVNGLL